MNMPANVAMWRKRMPAAFSISPARRALRIAG